MRVITVGLLGLVLAISLETSFGKTLATQELPGQQIVLINSLPVHGLPVSISNANLTKTETGYVLKFSASNSENEQILGLRYWLLILDSANSHGRAVDYSVGIRLNPYSMKEVVSLPTSSRLKLRDGDRVFLVLAQVIGRESIWEVLKAREGLESYAKGEEVKMPNVWRLPNEVDSKPRFSPIY